MKNKVTLIGLFVSIMFYGVSLGLAEKAEYKKLISFSSNNKSEDSYASITKLREKSLRWHEIWHVLINNLDFVSTVYISGGDIKGIAVFKSAGSFNINKNGEISIVYRTEHSSLKDIERDALSLSKNHTYITQAGRGGIENHNSIKTIYNDHNMKVIHRDQSDEYILYSHSASN